MTTYTPRGKVRPLIEAMQAEPFRTWTVPEAAAWLKVPSRGVMAMVAYAIRAKVVHRGVVEGRTVLRGSPFPAGQQVTPPPTRSKQPVAWATPADDIRIPRVVPDWKPPRMVPPRG